MISPLFQDIDRLWSMTSKSKIRLRIIGSTALMLQSNHTRGTKDSDVLETAHINKGITELLRTLAGVGTDLHKKHRLYVDVVSAALPFLPQVPLCHLQPELNASLEHFEIEVMSIVDVVVSKLKRYNANDAVDIEAMVSRGLVPHPLLVERFKAAVDHFEMDARAEDLPKYVENLHAVERDMLVVPETDIELPPWLSD
jgi:hypothetical protein